MALLILSPLMAVPGILCDCVHEVSDTPEMSSIPCCGPVPHPCCIESHDGPAPAAVPVAEIPANIRLPLPLFAELPNPILPVVEKNLSLVRSPRSERPPGEQCTELSFRQSWLI